MDKAKDEAELNEYLAKIRRTIAESEALLESVELRMAETDELLESQGLTREEVLKWKPTREMVLAVNEELKRKGLPPLDMDDGAGDFDVATQSVRALESERTGDVSVGEGVSESGMSERQRKFNNFMREYKL